MLKQLSQDFLRDRSGNALVEHTLLIAVIGISVVLSASVMGVSLGHIFSTVTGAITG